MNSRERILAAINFEPVDHIPLYAWCFGVAPDRDLLWEKVGKTVERWYTGRLEHIHTLPFPWDIEDDFRRVLAWREIGVDDVIEVSVPWGIDPKVTWADTVEKDGRGDVLVREYQTPSGTLRQAVRRTTEDPEEGWPVQPDHVALFEDLNIPRGVRNPLTEPNDLHKLQHVLTEPSQTDRKAYEQHMWRVREFCDREGVAAQAWAAFGMDAIVWLMGVEGAVLAALERTDSFEEAMDLVHLVDKARVQLTLDVGGVDIVVERGWYSSTDFWSPDLFSKFLLPRIRELAEMTHDAGKKFAYVMTTGVQIMADLLLETGIDLLYFVDPVQDQVDLQAVKDKFHGRIAIAGGVNSAVTLGSGNPEAIEAAVETACRVLGRDGGLILAPVDALFPNTPWSNVLRMIEAWKRYAAGVGNPTTKNHETSP